MAMDGLIYKGLKAGLLVAVQLNRRLAEAEIEYQGHQVARRSSSAFRGEGRQRASWNNRDVVRDLDDDAVDDPGQPGDLPESRSCTYALVDSEKGKLIVLEELVDHAVGEVRPGSARRSSGTFKGARAGDDHLPASAVRS